MEHTPHSNNATATIATHHHGPTSLPQGGAGGRVGVDEGRDQVLPPVGSVRVEAAAGGRVHEQRARVAGVRPLAVHPGARRGGLQRRLGRALEEAVAERVGDGADDRS